MITPSGIEIEYESKPKRLYRVRNVFASKFVLSQEVGEETWVEVPSVTEVLGVLDKPALPWWGMKVGVEGVQQRARHGLDIARVSMECICDWLTESTVDEMVAELTKHKLTVNHVKDKAADRGTSVHAAFETWCEHPEFRPNPDVYDENEQGYMHGLVKFLDDISEGGPTDIQSEIMVGSLAYRFAGRYDVRYRLQEPCEVTTRVYPKRPPKREVIPAGLWLKDVKTSKSVYPSHAAQLAAYELASVECGYGATDYQAVIHLTADGEYELVQTHAKAEDFLSVLACHRTMSKSKSWIGATKEPV